MVTVFLPSLALCFAAVAPRRVRLARAALAMDAFAAAATASAVTPNSWYSRLRGGRRAVVVHADRLARVADELFHGGVMPASTDTRARIAAGSTSSW